MMGEYADLQIREDIKRMHGFDPGDMSYDRPKRVKKPTNPAKHVCKRVKCPHCDATPKESGLRDHIRDVHGVPTTQPADAGF